MSKTNNHYEKGDYVAVNIPGHKSIVKGTVLSVLCENKSEYYLIEFNENALALVPRVDIVFRII